MEASQASRQFKHEFVDDLDIIKDKASKAKKTIHGLLNFMNERVGVFAILGVDRSAVQR